MNWVWVLSFSVLGSTPEHGMIAKYSTRLECQTALEVKRAEYQAQGKQLVANCYLSAQGGTGWWK